MADNKNLKYNPSINSNLNLKSNKTVKYQVRGVDQSFRRDLHSGIAFEHNPDSSNIVHASGFSPTYGDTVDSLSTNFFHPTFSPDLYTLPHNWKDERDLIRHFYERNPIVRSGIDILTELPISKTHYTLPFTRDSKKARKVLNYIKGISDKLDIFDLMVQIAHEYWLYGNAFIYVEKNPSGTDIERVLVLDPNVINVEKSAWSRENIIYLVPDERLRTMIRESFLDNDVRKLLSNIPDELQKAIYDNKRIELNTNPYDGSFVKHIPIRKSQYDVLGVPLLRSGLNDLMYQERLRQAQVSIAMRNLVPKHIITTDAQLDQDQMDELRDQVDQSMENPDFAIIASYNINWQQIGAESRILQLTSEYEDLNTKIAAALGLRKEMIMGDGVFGDTKLGLDMLDKRFSLFRDRMRSFIEDDLWGPICLKKGYTEQVGENKVILTPGLSFSRLSLRDNETVFANLYNMYTKGSLSVRTILDLFNIDPETEYNNLASDLFTLNDSRFNDMLASFYSDMGQQFSKDPRFKTLIAERGLNLKNYEPIVESVMSSKVQSVLSSKDSDSENIGNGVIKLGSADKLDLKDVHDMMLTDIKKDIIIDRYPMATNTRIKIAKD